MKNIKRRKILTGGAASLLLAASACGQADMNVYSPEVVDVEGIPELSQPLTPLATPCTYDGDTKTATVTVAATEIAVIAKRSLDQAMIVNGVACGEAKTNTLKKVDITGSTGVDTVIIDYINGTFATGTSSDTGIDVDLAGGTDAFKIRGTTGSDNMAFGDLGIAVNAGSSLDVAVTNVEEFTFSLGAGNDTFSGQGGNGSGDPDTVDLTVYGGEGNDSLTGGDGDDTIAGGPGNDTVAGAAGDDTLSGEEGDDTFDEGTASNGSDTFDGGDGTDIVSYAARTNAVTVTMDGTGNDGETSEADNVSNVEGVTGGAGDDTLTGGTGADIISGGAGDDTITGGAGDDTLNGDDGDDTFSEGSAASGADVFYGGAGTDLVSYASRTNAVTVTIENSANDGESGELDNVRSDVENITGGAGDDTITGSSSANVIDGGAGDDTLNGGAGNDTFSQGTADDGSDVINGGSGDDTVDYSGRTAALTVTMGDLTANDGLAGEADDIGADVENVDCGTGDDTVTGNDLDNVIDGGAGDDVLSGGAGNDELFGGAGDDTLNGDAGDDTLDGAAGTNTLDCGAGQGDIGFGTSTNCEL